MFINYALQCSESIATADRGLIAHRTKTREALIALLTVKVTDDHHKDILKRVFGSGVDLAKPILDVADPNLAPLIKFGIRNVIWETSECKGGTARSILKPIDCGGQEPLLDFLGMSLYIINELFTLV